MSHTTSYSVSRASSGLFSFVYTLAVIVIFATVIAGMVR